MRLITVERCQNNFMLLVKDAFNPLKKRIEFCFHIFLHHTCCTSCELLLPPLSDCFETINITYANSTSIIYLADLQYCSYCGITLYEIVLWSDKNKTPKV